MNKHPNQPIAFDDNGVARFRENSIVRWLVDQLPGGLSDISLYAFSREDLEQLTMLIGCSVSGAGDLPYVSDECIAEADAAVENLRAEKRRSMIQQPMETMPCVVISCEGVWHYREGETEVSPISSDTMPLDRMCDRCRAKRWAPPRNPS